jgi:hypothetical protein
MFVVLPMLMRGWCIVGMLRWSRFRNREKLLKAIEQLFQLHITSKQFFDLGTKRFALIGGLLMSKYVVVVLHFV